MNFLFRIFSERAIFSAKKSPTTQSYLERNPPEASKFEEFITDLSGLAISDTPDHAIRAAISEGLARHNRAYVGEPDIRPIAVVADNPSGGDIYGGLWGRTAWDWLHIELLYVSEAARGLGLGKRLIQAAETELLRRNCHSAWVDTYSFQACAFYERLGYKIFGTLENYPTGHKRFFLQKEFRQKSGLNL